ncbi:MAG TPA: hypothetical protein VGQ39_19125 [Pyrinomonadaceae bacterium]|jgi:hypothetical protein|nr:hypothetical protein [Pyrinomonadaceae bacterium]
MKRMLSSVLYALVVLSMIAGLSQVFERPVKATAGVCCAASSDCAGAQLCYAPTYPLQPCCDERAPGGCNGPNYCEDKRPD